MEIFRQITANNIALKDYPFLKELAMEAYLIENEDILKLDTENFADVTVLDAEIALKSGRKTSNRDGRIDILAKYGLDYLALIELKINEINESALIQLEDYKRHYLKPDELIKLTDSTIATSNQWGIGNITDFIDHVHDMGNDYRIENK